MELAEALSVLIGSPEQRTAISPLETAGDRTVVFERLGTLVPSTQQRGVAKGSDV